MVAVVERLEYGQEGKQMSAGGGVYSYYSIEGILFLNKTAITGQLVIFLFV